MNIRKIIILIISLVLSLSICACDFNISFVNNDTLTNKTSINSSTKNTDSKTQFNSSTILSKTTKNSSSIAESITTTISKKTTSNEKTTLNKTTTIKPTTSITTSEEIILTLTSTSSSIAKYYQNYDVNYWVNNLSSSEIKNNVYKVLSIGNISISYNNLGKYYYLTDKNPETGKVQLFYSHIEVSANNNIITFGSSADSINREHVWPQSLGQEKDEPGGHDLHQVRPTIASLNSARGNLLYGNCKNNGGSAVKYKNVIYGYKTNKVFEPLDNVKGDVARICFYYAIKYNYDLKVIVGDKTYKEILNWNEIDPVSDVEINRNNEVYKIQGNRNIFIDYPELANYIWG